jgi:parallel beta-helix repeat protein
MLLALVGLVALWGLLLALSPGPAFADATVNRTGNAPDTNPGNGRCDTSSTRGIQCTLRAAIEETNETETFADPDVIRFNIGGNNSVKTISPLSPLPELIGPTFIDGYTQRGASENTLEVGNNAVLKVQLSGTNAGTDASGLTITGSSSTIKGLVINGFDAHGIEIIGSGETFNRVEGNTIRLNGLSGVILSGGAGNSILSNRIFGNEGLGIDFDADGVTPNDTGDSDGGTNNRQNFPRIRSAIRDGSNLTVSGTLNSTSSQTFTIQCFLASPDPSGHGEGRSPFAEATVTTSNVGNANFSCTDNTVGFLVPGQQVTATATNTTTGDTSEFSANVPVRR